MSGPISPPVRNTPGRWVAILIGLAILGAGAAVWHSARGGGTPTLGPEFEYDVEAFTNVAPEQIRYQQLLNVDTGQETVRALAVGPEDRIFVASDSAILELEPDGTRRRSFELSAEPTCLAVAEDGRLFVGLTDHIEVLDATGAPQAAWAPPEEAALLTSVAVSGERLYTADAGHRKVWHYHTSGELVGEVAPQALARETPGFVVPSPYFDVAIAPDGLLIVVNPGRQRVESYFEDGTLVSAWGKASFDLDGFSGCCNPSHLAVLPDGRFVTSEKGLVRVKIHDAEGGFQSVVAEASTLGEDTAPREIAADSTGRIVILDPTTRTVRVFEPKQEGGPSGS